MKISGRVEGVEYAIRDIVESARQVKARGVRMHYLNIGDPCQFGFQPPPNVLRAFADAVQGGRNQYADSEGLPELREAIAAREAAKGMDVSGDGVLVTNGVSEGLDMVVSSIVDPGDEVLLPGPYYPPYASYVRLRGGVPVEFAADAGDGAPDPAEIRSLITPRTVAICLINPNNPTGTVIGGRRLRQILDVAGEHGLYVICDEIYDRITYGGPFEGAGSVARDLPVILLNGFSKVHMMTGWRLGYIAFNGSPGLGRIREHLPKLARVRICGSTPAQHAALESLRGPQDHITSMVSELQKRRDLAVRLLSEIPGITCRAPAGAFYAFPRIDPSLGTDKEFVSGLLEETGVLAVHGSGFGERHGSGHFRIVFLPPEEYLEEALGLVARYVNRSTR
ncbi:MAG: aminotransferase class I/II-fold pyridoxal phosphate-dependent enzyme [Nitrosopumilus sp.]|nr:aminotransferase class I/II-fold pyridoxal phosphate-dependent enzyme [Nitrosopumilus sp.]MDA7959870.1 aminotransferase class I/II-fold pyridoxal phosphate-dependent enzyme [Nitrosopumilus sp.]